MVSFEPFASPSHCGQEAHRMNRQGGEEALLTETAFAVPRRTGMHNLTLKSYRTAGGKAPAPCRRRKPAPPDAAGRAAVPYKGREETMENEKIHLTRGEIYSLRLMYKPQLEAFLYKVFLKGAEAGMKEAFALMKKNTAEEEAGEPETEKE
jgi:hypothetical protein